MARNSSDYTAIGVNQIDDRSGRYVEGKRSDYYEGGNLTVDLLKEVLSQSADGLNILLEDVRKDAVWPKLDFVEMAAQGYKSEAVYLIYLIRDLIPLKPYLKKSKSYAGSAKIDLAACKSNGMPKDAGMTDAELDEELSHRLESYVTVVQSIMEKAMTIKQVDWINYADDNLTEEDKNREIQKIPNIGQLVSEEITSLADSIPYIKTGFSSLSSVLTYISLVCANQNITCFSSYLQKVGNLIRIEYEYKKLGVQKSATAKLIKELEWLFTKVRNSDDYPYVIYREKPVLNGSPTVTTLARSTTIEGAYIELERKYNNGTIIAATDGSDTSKLLNKITNLVRPTLVKIERYAPNVRKMEQSIGGKEAKNAIPEMINQRYGSLTTGLEFGKWMTGLDRQAHLNYCYDALNDFAFILDAEPSMALLTKTIDSSLVDNMDEEVIQRVNDYLDEALNTR